MREHDASTRDVPAEVANMQARVKANLHRLQGVPQNRADRRAMQQRAARVAKAARKHAPEPPTGQYR